MTNIELFIKALKAEIRQQAWGLNQYINDKDWKRVAFQDVYLKGLEKALELAETILKDKREERTDKND